ncbi:MAG TPA: hypothetical protein VN372_07715 [Methanospirillum sp.]|nr:hypothetical protein [Methanospirillum sp.]
MNTYGIGLIIIGCILIFSIGCVGNEKNQQNNQTSGGVSESGISSSTWNDPVTQPPEELSASVSADEDAITHQIFVSYNGGGGQQLIKDMQVRFLMNGGLIEVRQLGKNKGDSVIVQGTNKTDRVQVAVSIMGGKSYKIFDRELNERYNPNE